MRLCNKSAKSNDETEGLIGGRNVLKNAQSSMGGCNLRHQQVIKYRTKNVFKWFFRLCLNAVHFSNLLVSSGPKARWGGGRNLLFLFGLEAWVGVGSAVRGEGAAEGITVNEPKFCVNVNKNKKNTSGGGMGFPPCPPMIGRRLYAGYQSIDGQCGERRTSGMHVLVGISFEFQEKRVASIRTWDVPNASCLQGVLPGMEHPLTR